MSDVQSRGRRLFGPGTTVADLKAYMAPFVDRLGYKFNTEEAFVEEVLESELEILEETGDIYCPCRARTGDAKEDAKIVCPCIPFFRDQFAGLKKCWCGLFILEEIEDGGELLGVMEEPQGDVEVPAFLARDVAPGQIRHVKIGKRDVAVANVDGDFFALSNVCRHAFGPLGEGFMDEHVVMCPWHGWRYDVRDGTTDHPNADVRTYDVVVRDGAVFVVVGARAG
ncbi:MAG: Rieske 2Fe-2S domain-containing protein [Coriobacteriia bacterium]|nr:Rieske 2Fe-2S domain-containing protein [Coriobacteriia bacterium]